MANPWRTRTVASFRASHGDRFVCPTNLQTMCPRGGLLGTEMYLFWRGDADRCTYDDDLVVLLYLIYPQSFLRTAGVRRPDARARLRREYRGGRD